VGVALVICACSTAATKTANPQPPPLSSTGAEQLMLRADDFKRLALADEGTATLADVFRGPALQMLDAQAQSMDQRGVRLEERNLARTLVFWDPRAHEAVLQVVAQSRLVSADQPNPTWSAIVRQWWARLQYADGRWWVVDQEDLAPDRWRQAG
jgi:hypothetical protein